MKHLLITALVSLAPFCANALIADSFSCTLTVIDNTTGDKSEQNYNFQLGRLPLSYSPASDIRLTGSSMTFSNTFNTKNHEISTNVNFYYKHATKLDGNGHVIDARQESCLTISSDACTKGSGNELKICGSSLGACMTSIERDPFNPLSNWAKVGFIDDVPMYNENALLQLSTGTFDENQNYVGPANIICKFKGTYQ